MKQSLLEKTIHIVEKKGADAVSMRDIAKKAGVSPMATYRHFSCKDELLLEVAAYGFDLLTKAGIDAALSEKTPLKKLESVLFAYYSFGLEHKNLFELMFGPLKKKQSLSMNFQKSAQASFMQFGKYVETFIGKSRLKEQKFEQQFASSVWSYIHGMTILSSNGYLSSQELSSNELELKVKLQISTFLNCF